MPLKNPFKIGFNSLQKPSIRKGLFNGRPFHICRPFTVLAILTAHIHIQNPPRSIIKRKQLTSIDSQRDFVHWQKEPTGFMLHGYCWNYIFIKHWETGLSFRLRVLCYVMFSRDSISVCDFCDGVKNQRYFAHKRSVLI